MKKLRKILCGVSVLILTSIATSPLMAADNSNFAGPYVGFQITAAGVELDGKVSSGQDTVGETTTGNVGRVAIIGGMELGYAVPLGSELLLDVGIAYIAGGAKIRSNTNDTAATADVIFEVDNVYQAWLAPTFALSDTSSAFVKLGYSHAEISVTGDVSKPSDMEGATYAIGTRTVLESGLFIKSEAGITEFNGLQARGLEQGGAGKNIATQTTVAADPTKVSSARSDIVQ